MPFGDEILNMIKQVREQKPEERTLCPDCEYELDKLEDGTLHCQFCGWHYPMRIKRSGL